MNQGLDMGKSAFFDTNSCEALSSAIKNQAKLLICDLHFWNNKKITNAHIKIIGSAL